MQAIYALFVSNSIKEVLFVNRIISFILICSLLVLCLVGCEFFTNNTDDDGDDDFHEYGGNLNMATLKSLIDIYGSAVSWDTFAPYFCYNEEVNGSYIRRYVIDADYELIIEGVSIDVPPTHIRLVRTATPDEYIDVRIDSIDDFLNEITTNAKYRLTVIDYWGYLIKPLDEYYKAGEEVEVTLAFLSGPSVGIELNGEYICENADTKYDGAYPIITFTMPEKDSVLYTTQNGNIGFLSTFSHAGSGIQNIYDNALNANKFGESTPRNLPIYKFDTLSDLEKFKSDFGGENGFNYGWDEVKSLNDATKNYDEYFFERYTLMLVYIEANSGSYRFGFKDVTIDGSYLCVHVEQTNNPEVFTDDMAGWFITVAIPDSMVTNITEFDANLF